MDLLVLRRLVDELDEKLRGRRIEQVWALPSHDVVVAVGRRSGPRLWFSAEPDDPHLYLRTGAPTSPQRPPGFAMAARGVLNGRHIAHLRLLQSDRIVELTCGGEPGPRVVFELIPRRATMLVLDAEGVVRAAWKPRRGRPALGEIYAPPGRDRRTALDDVDDATWADLQAAPDDDERVRGLLRTIAAMSPLVAREIAAQYDRGTPLPDAARAEVARAATAAAEPRIYAPGPVDELAELPSARRFLLAPYPLRHLETNGDGSVTPYPTLIDAAATFYPLRARLDALQAARAALRSALEIGAARAQRALDAVSDDADSAGDADQHRRRADLLLAYPHAGTKGSVARVPDPYAGEEAEMEIEIDPSMSLVDNAQRYYRRARRAERSVARTTARRATLRRRRAKLEELLRQAADADEVSACLRIARQARAFKVTVDGSAWIPPECSPSEDTAASPDGASATLPPVARDGREGDPDERRSAASAASRRGHSRKAPTARTAAGVDAFTSSDGFGILVGRSAKGNETVTHKLASPHDFWLHAEGPGSHVLIRNPAREKSPSDDALRQAASLAAWFSRARGATKVNVRWTQARHVKKPRGAPTGQVVLRQSQTFLAEPLPPERLFATDEDNEEAP